MGELTAGIAHEFRNGLATIHGYSKLFDLHALPPSYRPYVEGIRAETESLSQVVTNFLNFARPAQLTLTRVDLRAICERAAEEIRPDTRALGGEVNVRGEFDVIDGDDVLLRQAFSNLLRNALEACTGGPAPPQIVIQSDIDHAQKLSLIYFHVIVVFDQLSVLLVHFCPLIVPEAPSPKRWFLNRIPRRFKQGGHDYLLATTALFHEPLPKLVPPCRNDTWNPG